MTSFALNAGCIFVVYEIHRALCALMSPQFLFTHTFHSVSVYVSLERLFVPGQVINT